MGNTDLIEVLANVDPSQLNYQEWINVGMALKEEGYTAFDWDKWSMKDSRYHAGECEKKWNTFQGTGTPITGGTIVQMAMDRGWQPMRSGGHEMDWNDVISYEKDDLVIVDKGWVEGKELHEPLNWNPAKELITYLETLFDSDENVGFVTKSYKQEERYLPTKGCWDRPAGQLIQELNKHKDDICSVIGDYQKEAGAWIRFNH